jgi:hypothetical protein
MALFQGVGSDPDSFLRRMVPRDQPERRRLITARQSAWQIRRKSATI